MCNILDKKLLFDEVALDYENRRPTYNQQLFEDIISYSGITVDKSIIEIGCGTGQATEPFIKTKCKVTAVELSKNLALFAKAKFKDYTNFEVIQSSFEDYECDINKLMFYILLLLSIGFRLKSVIKRHME